MGSPDRRESNGHEDLIERFRGEANGDPRKFAELLTEYGRSRILAGHDEAVKVGLSWDRYSRETKDDYMLGVSAIAYAHSVCAQNGIGDQLIVDTLNNDSSRPIEGEKLDNWVKDNAFEVLLDNAPHLLPRVHGSYPSVKSPSSTSSVGRSSIMGSAPPSHIEYPDMTSRHQGPVSLDHPDDDSVVVFDRDADGDLSLHRSGGLVRDESGDLSFQRSNNTSGRDPRFSPVNYNHPEFRKP